MLPDALWARKGPFLHSNKKGPYKQASRWYFMITPPWGCIPTSLIRATHVRHARSRESENFYKTGPSKTTKFYDSVQKDVNVTSQVSTLFFVQQKPCKASCKLVLPTDNSQGYQDLNFEYSYYGKEH